jgi:formate transporter
MVLFRMNALALVGAVVGLMAGADAFHMPHRPATGRQAMSSMLSSANKYNSATTVLNMSADGDDRSERASLDISKTIYTSSIKSPKDSYIAFAEKGASNAKMSWRKIIHQSILGGCYVGFGGLLSLCVAGNLGGIGASNPGAVKMAFAALFPVNLLLIVTTGGQLFTGNSATVAAAKYEKLVTWRELIKSFSLSVIGNVIGCGLFALAANYVGLLTGGTADLLTSTALGKCRATFGQTFVKAILCNWMVSLAVFLAGASNDLAGKLVGVWFPISTFVAIGLEHSVANLFIMPAALLLKIPLTLGDVVVRNILPVLAGNGKFLAIVSSCLFCFEVTRKSNVSLLLFLIIFLVAIFTLAVAGAFVVAGSYSYQFGRLGGSQRAIFKKWLQGYEERKVEEGELAKASS